MLDSDVCIDLLRRKAEARTWFAALLEPPAVSGFAALELVQGCQNSADLRDVDKLLRQFVVVWPSTADMQAAYAHYHAFVLSSGIGLLDCLIAFTAIGRGETLCTFNVKHYRMVVGLVTEQPYKHT